LRYQNEKLQLENERLKSQFKYANRGEGVVVPDLERQKFDIGKLRDKYGEHAEKYAQLRREFRGARDKISGLRDTMIQWRKVFKKHDPYFEDDLDLS
jgi:hypothetical protein